MIKSPFDSKIPKISGLSTFFDLNDTSLLKDLYVNAQLEQKFNTKKQEIQLMSLNNFFNLNDNKATTILDNYVDFENMQEMFYETVSHIIVRKIDNQFHFRVLDENDYMLTGKPLILLDHIPVFDPNVIDRG